MSNEYSYALLNKMENAPHVNKRAMQWFLDTFGINLF